MSYRIYLALLILTQLQRGPGGLGKKKKKRKKKLDPFAVANDAVLWISIKTLSLERSDLPGPLSKPENLLKRRILD